MLPILDGIQPSASDTLIVGTHDVDGENEEAMRILHQCLRAILEFSRTLAGFVKRLQVRILLRHPMDSPVYLKWISPHLIWSLASWGPSIWVSTVVALPSRQIPYGATFTQVLSVGAL